MKKQVHHFNSLFKLICLSGIFTLAMLTGLYGQDYMDNGRFIPDGNLYTIPAGDQKIRDIVVPPLTSGKYLYLKLEGADGGRVRRECSNHWSPGGEGATVIVYAKIGNAAGQIPEGAHVRFIVGERGSSTAASTAYDRIAGSGGGTGVAFRPRSGEPWQLLAVAGAGSGATGNCYSSYYHADPGQGIVATKITSSGGSGGSPSNLDPGTGICAGGGGGAFSDGETASSTGTLGDKVTAAGGKAGWPGGPDSGIPTGGAGGPNSGWGFGGGGGSLNKSGVSGGGGGYTGGNVNTSDRDDNHISHSYGGGSFYNQDYVLYGTAIVNGTTEHPDDGYVAYQFLDALPALPPVPFIKLASASEKCIDVDINSFSMHFDNGGNLRLWDCIPNVITQNWTLDGNQIKLVRDESKCMDVKDHQTTNATNVRVWDCMDHNEQKWIYDGLTWQLRSYLDIEKCLNDAYGGRTDNGTNIMLWDCINGGGKSDRWDINKAEKVADRQKAKFIVPVKAANLAVQSADYKGLESNIQLWDKADGNYAEQWYFDGMQIKLRTQQNLCIDLKSSNTSNGNNIQLWTCNGTDAQKWIYDGLTRTIRLAANLNKCMEVATSGGVFEKGKNIQIMDCNGLMRQKFLVVE